MTIHRIELDMDNIYKVIHRGLDIEVFKGTLLECDAWIKLTEMGYMT